MIKYVALLRGVNVGGNNRVVMADLKAELVHHGLQNVVTYINSGNIIFTSTIAQTKLLAQLVKSAVLACSKVDCDVVVVRQKAFNKIVARAPGWWGKDPSWKHNLLFVIPPTTVKEIIASIGQLKPDIEYLEAGKEVLYQSMSFAQFGKTTTGKLAGSPIYKRVTIRNFNTVLKLSELVKTDQK